MAKTDDLGWLRQRRVVGPGGPTLMFPLSQSFAS